MAVDKKLITLHLAEVLKCRKNQVALRVVYGVIFLVVYGGIVSWPVAIVWFAGYGAIQILEFLLFHRGEAKRAWLALVILFANGLSFGCLAMLTPNKDGFSGIDLPILLIVGGLLNAVLLSRRSAPAFIANSLPYGVYLQVMNFKAYVMGADLQEIVLLSFGGITLYIFSFLIWKGSATDISAAAHARERAEAADAAKSIFLANMSHELRTPMNGVLGMAQVLRRSELTPAQTEQVEMLLRSGDHLMGLLNDILDWSKIDAGSMAIAPTVTDLPDLLQQAASFWRPRADDKGLDLRLALAPDLPRYVQIDPLRLKQILFNLIGNAMKFTAEGAVTISAELSADAPPALVFAVADTGIGMTPEVLGRLFARFSQASAATSRTYGGTGLGLAISRRLSELMGGGLDVRSAVGQGSVFTVTLPLERAEAGAATRDAQEDEVGRPMDVLTIDDHAVNLKVVELLLSSAGHRVVCAQSAADGLTAAAMQAFDVILTDMHMPPSTGLDVLNALRSAPGPNRATPVYVVTADAMQNDLDAVIKHGFSGHVTKPIAAHDLFAVLQASAAASPRQSPPVAAAVLAA